ncbi:bifunctional hydroxymethylpyrimidine kinase/phosphomethylpyrimidine kinase [Janthinobacterium psychrotolerans]|uniref:Hydroxymethylpyrimidine/phosphomethylpyrimidine kinase n=1 Tax=Janthinobacterium psychrotolerans TaxID=1747903 RepID=A0A1A7BZE9_9BURK|nr:bifunctional hydroxymethylpyrimidine kinase/phosphomethylpyrimidine kinase [Janthinobacterium psychrotolerans]OBV39046.1 hydroxymethylpyrimidine/phosphomethylpyrimidine kinase [Janthinobacterium psychrotolerans]
MAATRPAVLVFAGLDPSGGAGIAADILAIAAQGAHALPIVTALTVQDNDRVFEVRPVDAALLLRQAQALMDKMAIAAVKIGIPGSAANAAAIARVIAQLRRAQPGLPVVLDPVLASGHGDVLSTGDAVLALAPLLPLTTVIVPNGPEASRLTGIVEIDEQAAALLARGCSNVLVTGGHGEGDNVVNRWFGVDGEARQWQWPRLSGEFHGSGCTLAAAIAARLALRQAMPEALAAAQAFCHAALAQAYAVAPGQLMPQRLITLQGKYHAWTISGDPELG